MDSAPKQCQFQVINIDVEFPEMPPMNPPAWTTFFIPCSGFTRGDVVSGNPPRLIDDDGLKPSAIR